MRLMSYIYRMPKMIKNQNKLDRYDSISIWTLIISFLFCVYLIYKTVTHLKKDDDVIVFIISDVSSVFSIGGLIIAVLQIFKVSSNTKTYKEAYDKTLSVIKNNEAISLVSRSLQQLLIIKYLFENKNETSSRNYFNNLGLDLTFLKENNLDNEDKEILKEFISYCKEMDTLLYKTVINVNTDLDFSSKYETLTEIQTFLISLQQKLGVPKD